MINQSEYFQRWIADLSKKQTRVRAPEPVVEGRLTRMVGLTLEAIGCEAAVGTSCNIIAPGNHSIEAEVVGFSGDKTYLMAMGESRGLIPNAKVIPVGHSSSIEISDGFLGRVIDGRGRPLDGKGPIKVNHDMAANMPLAGKPINPLMRDPIKQPLDVGVRAINSLLTVGRGQRMGLFAGTGVGKSILLGMMTKYTEADVIVVGLIGERGREVKEFVQDILGKDGIKRACVVAAPADSSPLVRIHGAMLATSVAEYFRDQGKKVLLLMDSLSRFAQAQREIGLSISEPPATKGYPPSVFARIPQLVERAGNGQAGQGSITAFYTVLTEGDDNNDPIADAARGILDGHIVLSRQLADMGQYPAIDLESSVSRVMPMVTNENHISQSQQIKQLYSIYEQNRDLINVGAYQQGTNPVIDQAIAMQPHIQAFMRQSMNEAVPFKRSQQMLADLIKSANQLGQPDVNDV
ncbi:MAG: flagellar protein export ATPase FliI [endosymbiont of Galathealinum brachiosum]|uniref:Flagellum-specific ATP synthase n=1 Tax=endosymbiont of Galathealinum brachiosum TaxID=2200906 RepID=A0A370DIH8_9GAMM|nr:MAG: flagellar protein export ATPase FliI [endosymbiont of Galathealinum brachiosum]